MRDVKYIFKKIIIGTGIALLLMLIKGNLALKVSARTISMSTPDTFGYYTINGQSTQNTITSQQASSGTLSDIPVYISQLVPQNSHGGMAYEWTNANLCVNDDLTVSGVLHAPTITNITWTSGYFNSWSEMKSCSFYKSGNNAYRFTCSGTGGGGFVVYFGFQMDRDFGGFLYLERDLDIYCNATANDIISNANNNTTQIINNNNENTQNIINNQNENTQQIIQSITGGAEATIESQKVCNQYDKNSIIQNGILQMNGVISNPSNINYGITDYIRVDSTTSIDVSNVIEQSFAACFYGVNKNLISCTSMNGFTGLLSIPSGSYYFRGTVNLSSNKPTYTICQNGNQAIADGQQQINDTLNNDDVTGATSEAESFFDNFTSDSHGLSGIITAPLRLIQSLSSSTCSSLTIPLPFVQTNATLPCMSTIYSTYFPTFLTLYQLITTGLIGYWVLIKLFGHVKGMQDPKDDRIEVLDL